MPNWSAPLFPPSSLSFFFLSPLSFFLPWPHSLGCFVTISLPHMLHHQKGPLLTISTLERCHCSSYRQDVRGCQSLTQPLASTSVSCIVRSLSTTSLVRLSNTRQPLSNGTHLSLLNSPYFQQVYLRSAASRPISNQTVMIHYELTSIMCSIHHKLQLKAYIDYVSVKCDCRARYNNPNLWCILRE